MADYFEQCSGVFDPGETNRETVYRYVTQRNVCAAENDEPFGFSMKLQDDGIWLQSDHGGAETIGQLLVDAAGKFDLQGRWALEFANTCTKPRLHSFGGFVLLVDLTRRAFGTLHTAEIVMRLHRGEELLEAQEER